MRHSFLMTQIVITIKRQKDKLIELERESQESCDVVRKANIAIEIQFARHYLERAKEQRRKLYSISLGEQLGCKPYDLVGWKKRFGW